MVQWFKDGLPLNGIEYDIRAEGTKNSISIPYSRSRDHGRYVCQADNPQGKATCSAQVTVKPAERFMDPTSPSYPLFEKTFVRESPELHKPVEIIDTVEEHEKITETFARPIVPSQPPLPMPKPVTVPVVPKKWVPPSQSTSEKTTARVEHHLNLAPATEMKPLVHEKPHMFTLENAPRDHISKGQPVNWNMQYHPTNAEEAVPFRTATEIASTVNGKHVQRLQIEHFSIFSKAWRFSVLL